MKILVIDSGAYTIEDILYTFGKYNISYKFMQYFLADKIYDEAFVDIYHKLTESDSYDAVFSVNYYPIIASCCKERNIKYISWSYDNPLDVENIEDTLGYETNFAFMFDRIQVEKYRKKGFNNVYYLPLAVNCERLDKTVIKKQDVDKYKADISFVGKLYDSLLEQFIPHIDDYCNGYLKAVCDAQFKIYGAYIVDDLLNDSFMTRINMCLKNAGASTDFILSKEALSYSIATHVTRRERLVLCNLLANKYDFKLYSDLEDAMAVKNAKNMGRCDYISEMPKVFKLSGINMNISLKIIQSGISLRQLDIMGSKGFLLSNFQPELAEYFVNEEDCVMYDSIEDAYDKANFYLNHEDLRLKIANNGYNKVREFFSYDERIKTILETGGLS